MRLLLIDDDARAAAYLARALREASRVVDRAGDMATARVMLGDGVYDAVVMERRLAGSDASLWCATALTPTLSRAAGEGAASAQAQAGERVVSAQAQAGERAASAQAQAGERVVSARAQAGEGAAHREMLIAPQPLSRCAGEGRVRAVEVSEPAADRTAADLRGLLDLRASGLDLPILLLSPDLGAADRADCLRAGADDVLVRPYAFVELDARLDGLVARHRARPPGLSLRLGPLTLDPARREAAWSGQPIELARRELLLLQRLARHAGEVVTRDDLLEAAWELEVDPPDRWLDRQMHRLRRKVEEIGAHGVIEVVRGVGYRLKVDPTDRHWA